MEVESVLKREELNDPDISPEMFVKTELKEEPLEEAQTILKNRPEIECTLVKQELLSDDEVNTVIPDESLMPLVPMIPLDDIKMEFADAEFVECKSEVVSEVDPLLDDAKEADTHLAPLSSYGMEYDHFMNTVESISDNVYYCYHCNFTVNTRKRLKKHIVSKHILDELESFDSLVNSKGNLDGKLHKCSLCHFTALNTVSLALHIKSHSGKRPFKCNICSYRAANKSLLITHKEIHNEQKLLTCEMCGYKANSKAAWKNHIRDEHSSDRPFRCKICNYAAKVKKMLTMHMKRHTGQKPFKCSECDFRALLQSEINMHMRKHTGEKRYKCTKCNFRSNRNSDLTKHMNIHLVGRAPPKMLDLS